VWRAFEVVEGWPARPTQPAAPGGGGPALDGVGDLEGEYVPGLGDSGEPDGLLLVPKRRQSYSRKRHRQSNPLYREHETPHIYPCPKCDKGLLKLRHHVCPCDQERAGVNGIVRVTYGTPPARNETV
jgi:ribosomal protein L32